MNATLKDGNARLKLVVFSGRPCFYFYSKFRTVGKNWMGDEGLGCATDEEFVMAVKRNKEGYDDYQKIRHLQLEFIESHEEVSSGVFATAMPSEARSESPVRMLSSAGCSVRNGRGPYTIH